MMNVLRCLFALSAAFMLAGCGEQLQKRDLSPSLATIAPGQLLDSWRRDWPADGDVISTDGPRNMVLIGKAAQSGSPALGRFQLRAIMVDEKSNALAPGGSFDILMMLSDADHDDNVGGWQFSPDKTQMHFTEGVLPGYFFDLHWVRPQGASIYRLVVRWQSADGSQSIIRSLRFEDALRGAVNTASR